MKKRKTRKKPKPSVYLMGTNVPLVFVPRKFVTITLKGIK